MRRPAPRPHSNLLAFLVCTSVAGCTPERDPIAANHVMDAGDETATIQWGDEDRAEAIAAMRDALAGTEAIRPTAAANGVRWSDVWLSVFWGVSEYEMAIREVSEETDERMVFQLENAFDEPATMVVERVGPPEHIKASASVGTFGQREVDARGIEQAFRRYLEAFGRKPGFEKRPDARTR